MQLRQNTLAPDIIHAALTGTLPYGVSVDVLRKITTDGWEEQRRLVCLE